MIREYYRLAKPGIVYGNLLSAAGGFFMASRGQIDLFILIAQLVGIALVMGAGCVFNNYIDRGLDIKMERTRGRALVNNRIPVRNALLYGTVLVALGLSILFFFATHLAAYVALAGFVLYVVVYGIAKRKTVYGTLVGSLSGSVPPVVGYTAVTSQLDLGALLLFLILAAWQMPHFYAIAIYRKNDYQAAGLPVMSVVRGIAHTKQQIIWFIVAFILLSTSLTIFGFTGYIYLILILAAGLYWLYQAVSLRKVLEDDRWARKIFKLSLMMLLIFNVLISINPK